MKPKNAKGARAIDDDIVIDGTWTAFTSAVLLGASRFNAKATTKEEYHHEEEAAEATANTSIPTVNKLSTAEHEGNVDVPEHLQHL